MELPPLSLTKTPARHADCCLSLSTKLMDILSYEFSRNVAKGEAASILSVGSGTGLLEALLIAHMHSQNRDDKQSQVSVEGIEVHQPVKHGTVNKYLPEQSISTVRGTWDLSPRLKDTDTSGIMFTYPRDPVLVRKYTEAIRNMESQLSTVIWLGPRADWPDFEPCFAILEETSSGREFGVELRDGDSVGLAVYEMMVIIRR